MRNHPALLVTSFVLGLLGASTPAMARPDYIYVNVDLYLSYVNLSSPLVHHSITRKPPTVEGRIKLDRFCTLEVFKKTYKLQNCNLRDDSTIFTNDNIAFFIKDADLISIANDIVRLGEVYANEPALTAAADHVLKNAATTVSPDKTTEITNIYKWDGVDEDLRTSTMIVKGGRGVAGGLVMKFDLGGVREYNRATR